MRRLCARLLRASCPRHAARPDSLGEAPGSDDRRVTDEAPADVRCAARPVDAAAESPRRSPRLHRRRRRACDRRQLGRADHRDLQRTRHDASQAAADHPANRGNRSTNGATRPEGQGRGVPMLGAVRSTPTR